MNFLLLIYALRYYGDAWPTCALRRAVYEAKCCNVAFGAALLAWL